MGVPIGLIGIALLLYVLRRYLEHRNSCISAVYFPPDPIDPFATRIIPKIELDAIPNAIHELDGTAAPSELESSASAVADAKRPSSIISELEGSPVTPSASMATTLNRNRWSNASSLAPPQTHRVMAARPSIAESLSIVSQQHHGSGQVVFLTPPRPHASHRVSRPTSGLLPEIEVLDDEIPSTPNPSIDVVSEQVSNELQESHGGEQAAAVQATHDFEQVIISESSRTSDEAPQAGESAQAGEGSHEGETANNVEASRKSGTDAQAGGAAQAEDTSHKVKTTDEGEDPRENGVNAQAGEDLQAGEKPQEDGTAHQIGTETHSSR